MLNNTTESMGLKEKDYKLSKGRPIKFSSIFRTLNVLFIYMYPFSLSVGATIITEMYLFYISNIFAQRYSLSSLSLKQ